MIISKITPKSVPRGRDNYLASPCGQSSNVLTFESIYEEHLLERRHKQTQTMERNGFLAVFCCSWVGQRDWSTGQACHVVDVTHGMAMSAEWKRTECRTERGVEDQSGTHSACTSHRCSSWTGAPCPHSPSPRFWVSERCILSSSSGCTLSHRWTTYSTLSTGHPLPHNRQGRTGVERMALQMRWRKMRIARVGERRCDPETRERETHVKVERSVHTQSLVECL